MKKLQWWLHEMADKVTIFALHSLRGGIGGELAFRLANWLDRIAARVGGNTW